MEAELLSASSATLPGLRWVSDDGIERGKGPFALELLQQRLNTLAADVDAGRPVLLEAVDRINQLSELSPEDQRSLSVELQDGRQITVELNDQQGFRQTRLDNDRLIIGSRNELSFPDNGNGFQRVTGTDVDVPEFRVFSNTDNTAITRFPDTRVAIEIASYQRLVDAGSDRVKPVQSDLQFVADLGTTGELGGKRRLFDSLIRQFEGDQATIRPDRNIEIRLDADLDIHQSRVEIPDTDAGSDSPIRIVLGSHDIQTLPVLTLQSKVTELYGVAFISSYSGPENSLAKGLAQNIFQIGDSQLGQRVGFNEALSLVSLPVNSDTLYHALVDGARHDVQIRTGTQADFVDALGYWRQPGTDALSQAMTRANTWLAAHPDSPEAVTFAKALLQANQEIPAGSQRQAFRADLSRETVQSLRNAVQGDNGKLGLELTRLSVQVGLDQRSVNGDDGLNRVVPDDSGSPFRVYDPSEIDSPLPTRQRANTVVQKPGSSDLDSRTFMVTDGGGDLRTTEFTLLRSSQDSIQLEFRPRVPVRCARQGSGCESNRSSVVLDDEVDVTNGVEAEVQEATRNIATLPDSSVERHDFNERGSSLYLLEVDDGSITGQRRVTSGNVQDAFADQPRLGPSEPYVPQTDDDFATVLKDTSSGNLYQALSHVDTDSGPGHTGWPLNDGNLLSTSDGVSGVRHNILVQTEADASRTYGLEVRSAGSPGDVDTRVVIETTGASIQDHVRVSEVSVRADATPTSPPGLLFRNEAYPAIAYYVSPEYQQQVPDYAARLQDLNTVLSAAFLYPAEDGVAELTVGSFDDPDLATRPQTIDDLVRSNAITTTDSANLRIDPDTRILLVLDTPGTLPPERVPLAWDSTDAARGGGGTFSTVHVDPSFNGPRPDHQQIDAYLSRSSDFLRQVYQATEQNVGDYRSDLTPDQIRGIESDFREELGLPRLANADTPVNVPRQDTSPGRIGFEEEFYAFKVQDTDGSSRYTGRGGDLAQSDTLDAGVSRLALTIDEGTVKQTRLEVVYGPQDSDSYSRIRPGETKPDFYLARDLLIQTLKETPDEAGGSRRIQDVVDSFNTRLDQQMGEAGRPYRLTDVLHPDYRIANVWRV